jgi:biotin carboxylase
MGMDEKRPEILCISTYEKGQAFLREAARLGCAVTLLTVHKLADADWPKDVLAGFHTMDEGLAPREVLPVITRMVRHTNFRRIIALDEFDLEAAALAREHLRLPGMGETATRVFRDKLAMRETADKAGVLVPAYFSVANHDELWWFLQRTATGTADDGTKTGNWLLKPRFSASAIGIRRVHSEREIWPLLETLGDEASWHLLETFVPGEIYHVDAISWQGEIVFSVAHKYGHPPIDTMHTGGVFTTRTLDRMGDEAMMLRGIHARVLKALGMRDGVTHTEFIRAHADGQFHFLESAARVGGAYIAEVVEAANGVNPWAEWARIEVALLRGEPYRLPALRQEYAGSVICLARQEEPDTSAYADPEVIYRLRKYHHAGVLLRSKSAERIESLTESYGRGFLDDFCTRLEPPDKPRD